MVTSIGPTFTVVSAEVDIALVAANVRVTAGFGSQIDPMTVATPSLRLNASMSVLKHTATSAVVDTVYIKEYQNNFEKTCAKPVCPNFKYESIKGERQSKIFKNSRAFFIITASTIVTFREYNLSFLD